MNRSTLLIVASGFFFALLAAVAVQMLGSSGKKDKEPTAQTKTVDVLIAAKDLKIGEELTAGSTQWATWPEHAAFAGAVVREDNQSTDKALSGRVKRAISKGEPMMKSAMIDNTKSNFVAATLTPGMRAVSVSVNAQSSVAGFVSPGDRVDIVLTYDVKLPSDEKIRKAALPVVTKMASETILQNLRVLAVDQETDQQAEAKIVKTVTVEVDPRQAETMVLAGEMGKISLVLRSLGDESPAHLEGKSYETTTDLRVSGVMREIMKGENNTGSLSQVVRVYSGTRVENVEVRPYASTQ